RWGGAPYASPSVKASLQEDCGSGEEGSLRRGGSKRKRELAAVGCADSYQRISRGEPSDPHRNPSTCE
ncbi:hypothetical protein CRG98_031790, partial [Punica granatum]